MFLHLPLEGSLGHNYTEHQLQCMLHRLIASNETHSPEFDKPSVLAKRYRFHNAFTKNLHFIFVHKSVYTIYSRVTAELS